MRYRRPNEDRCPEYVAGKGAEVTRQKERNRVSNSIAYRGQVGVAIGKAPWADLKAKKQAYPHLSKGVSGNFRPQLLELLNFQEKSEIQISKGNLQILKTWVMN